MKKLLSVLICIAMLMTGFAFAEGGKLTISNVSISDNEGNALDLSGIDLSLAAAGDDAGAGLRVAVGANGEDVLSGVATLSEQGVVLKLDGMKNAYTVSFADVMMMLMADPEFQQLMQLVSALDFTEEDLAELMAIMEQFELAYEASITDTGIQEIDGVAYETYAINFPEAGYDAAYRGIFGLLDKHPALVSMLLEGSGYASMMEVYEAMGLRVRAEGTIIANESEAEVDLTGYGSSNDMEEMGINFYAYLTNGRDEEAGVEAVDLSLLVSALEDGELFNVVEANGCVTNVSATGELASFDGYLLVNDGFDEWSGFTFGLYSPQMTGTGLWLITIGDSNGEVSFNLSFGEEDGVSGIYGQFGDAENQLSFFAELQGSEGEIGFATAEGDYEMEFLADVAFSADDCAWMRVDTTNAVNLLTITEEQTETAGMEAMMVLMNALSELAAANDDFAIMMGNLMG